jgi:homocitrate synthase NifV
MLSLFLAPCSLFSKIMNTNPIKIIDTTLRDGEQAPGVVFSLNERLTIAGMLDKIGIDELEVGSPFISDRDIKIIRKIVDSGFKFRSSCWSRAKIEDIDAAHKTGAEGINISYSVSDIQLEAMGRDRNWVFSTMPQIVAYAQQRFKYVSLGAQDASRADLNLLTQYVKMAEKLGVHRVRLADTVGILNPFSTYELISKIVTELKSDDMAIEFHGHNDLGMATANSISALHAGANSVSVTVNGLGERSGNAALEEVIMALKTSMGINCNYNTSLFYELSRFVESASGRKLCASKPIVGDMTHKHESGIHTSSIIRNKRSYELFDAKEVGKSESTFVFGTHSGSASIIDFFHKQGIEISKDEAINLLLQVKTLSKKHKRDISSKELTELRNCQNLCLHTTI